MPEQLRIVQVGVGGWGDSWLDRVIASPSWHLAAIVDANPDALESVLERARGVPTFGSVADAVNEIQADAALIAVPVGAHLDVATQALDAGWHVLVEKPIADTMAHSHELVRRARTANRTLMVSQNYRFRRTAQLVTDIVRQGWLGQVHFASIQVHKQMHFVLPDVPHGFDAYTFVRDAGIHHFDQIRACLNVEPVRVYGRQHNPDWSWFTHPPMISALLELEGGGIVQFYGSWIARGQITSFDGDWHVEFANGQLRWESNRVFVRPVEPWLSIQMDGFEERRDGWMEAIIPKDRAEDRTRVLEIFAQCVHDGSEPPTSGEDNLHTAALAFAIADSAADGLPRDLAPYLESVD